MRVVRHPHVRRTTQIEKSRSVVSRECIVQTATKLVTNISIAELTIMLRAQFILRSILIFQLHVLAVQELFRSLSVQKDAIAKYRYTQYGDNTSLTKITFFVIRCCLLFLEFGNRFNSLSPGKTLIQHTFLLQSSLEQIIYSTQAATFTLEWIPMHE